MPKTNNNQWLIIANPAAGNGKVRLKWDQIAALLQTLDFDFEVIFTEHQGHGIELSKKGIEEGFRKIIAVGGDGTGHEVVNGIMTQNTCPSNDILFTMLTVGTGNDWIKTHQLPKSFEKNLTIIKQEKTAYQDIGLVHYCLNGKVQKRYFFNVAGLAYDGFLGKVLSERTDKITNQLHYLFNIAKWLFKFDIPKAAIHFNDKIVEGYYYTINIGICRYSGGGMIFVPHAQPNDGQLALTIVKKIPKWLVLLLTPFYYNGKLNWLPFVSLHQSQNIKIKALSNEPVYLEADGEYLGEAPVEFELIRNALKIVVP